LGNVVFGGFGRFESFGVIGALIGLGEADIVDGVLSYGVGAGLVTVGGEALPLQLVSGAAPSAPRQPATRKPNATT
jgi:hypothetical protein